MAKDDGKDGIFGSLTVMAVDDSGMDLRLVTMILDGLGVGTVIAVESAGQALERLDEGDAAVDLVISDIMMPEMDGYELISRIRSGAAPAHQDVPILVLLGIDTKTNVRKTMFNKIDGFIAKPPTAEILEQSMREALGL